MGSKARPCNNADEKFTVAGKGFGYGFCLGISFKSILKVPEWELWECVNYY